MKNSSTFSSFLALNFKFRDEIVFLRSRKCCSFALLWVVCLRLASDYNTLASYYHLACCLMVYSARYYTAPSRLHFGSRYLPDHRSVTYTLNSTGLYSPLAKLILVQFEHCPAQYFETCHDNLGNFYPILRAYVFAQRAVLLFCALIWSTSFCRCFSRFLQNRGLNVCLLLNSRQLCFLSLLCLSLFSESRHLSGSQTILPEATLYIWNRLDFLRKGKKDNKNNSVYGKQTPQTAKTETKIFS